MPSSPVATMVTAGAGSVPVSCQRVAFSTATCPTRCALCCRKVAESTKPCVLANSCATSRALSVLSLKLMISASNGVAAPKVSWQSASSGL